MLEVSELGLVEIMFVSQVRGINDCKTVKMYTPLVVMGKSYSFQEILAGMQIVYTRSQVIFSRTGGVCNRAFGTLFPSKCISICSHSMDSEASNSRKTSRSMPWCNHFSVSVCILQSMSFFFGIHSEVLSYSKATGPCSAVRPLKFNLDTKYLEMMVWKHVYSRSCPNPTVRT